ncbi:MAG TPA: hypothetical protein VFV42_01450 [Acidimicrobiales bacterium]|nr:hypothetical protein [Acidimicrobiales bacterium]
MTAIRLDWVARERRDSVSVEEMRSHDVVVHYSIPNHDTFGGGAPEAPSAIESAKLRVDGGELLVSRLNPHKPRVLITRPHDALAVCSGEFVVLKMSGEADRRFLYWRLISDDVTQRLSSRVQSVTRSQARVSAEVIRKLWLELPSPEEQRRIADYLDDEVARIDELIGEQQQCIDLSRERHASLGEELIRSLLVSLPATRFAAWVTNYDSRIGKADQPVLLAVSIHDGVVPRHRLTDKPPRALDFENYKVCDVGDVVLNRLRAFQGGVGVSSERGLVSPDYMVLRPNSDVEPQFLHHLVRSSWFVGQMTARLRGIGEAGQGNVRTPRVNWSDLRLIKVPAVTVEGQRRLAAEMDADANQVDQLTEELTHQIGLLREHRQALITHAVTHGIDGLPGVA